MHRMNGPGQLSKRSGGDRRRGSALLSVLALLSACLFVALIALQVMELQHYRTNPSIWPPSASR